MHDKQTKALLSEIRAFIQRTGMKPSYFGKLAAGNSELVSRLEAGGSVKLPTAERVRTFITSYER